MRKARKRGGKASGRRRSHELVPVLVARDRAGQTADFILEVDDSEHAADKLKPLMDKDTILCTEGDATMCATARKLGLAPEKVIVTVDQHANTSAASVPLALDHAVRDGRIKPGDLVVMEAMGGGFTWGACLLQL